MAARFGRSEVITLLLEHPNVDPDTRDYEGYRPLQVAARFGVLSTAKILAESPRVDMHAKVRVWSNCMNFGRYPLDPLWFVVGGDRRVHAGFAGGFLV